MSFLPANEFEKKGPYLKKKFDNGLGYNVGLGYKINDIIRTDINFIHTNIKYAASDPTVTSLQQKIQTNGILMNYYASIPTKYFIVPFLTAGIGYSNNKSHSLVDVENDISYPGSTTNNFIWNVGAGATFAIHKKLNIDLSYKYLDWGRIVTKNYSNPLPGASQKINSHNIAAGIVIYL